MGLHFIHGKISNEDLLGLHDGPGELFELLGHDHDGRQAFFTSCGCDPVEQAAWWFRVPWGFVEENLGHAVIRSGAMFVDLGQSPDSRFGDRSLTDRDPHYSS